MVATLAADIDVATWEGDTTALFAFCNDGELRPLAELLLRAAPEVFTGNPRYQQAPARPSRWPDLLSDAIDAVATRSLRGLAHRLGLGSDLRYADALADTARRLGVPATDLSAPAPLEQAILARTGQKGEVALSAAFPAEIARLGDAAAIVFRVAALRSRRRARLGLDPARSPAADTLLAERTEAEAEAARGLQSRLRWSGFRTLDELIGGLAGGERLGFARIPPCNILVCGKSGVGKSTLVNAVFGRDLAQTGVGRPVTEAASWFEEPGFPVRLLDTRGLQPGDYAGSRAALEAAVRTARRGERADAQLHLAWLCIDNGAARIEEGDVALARMLGEQEVPVICVLTKGWEDRRMEEQVRRTLSVPAVVRVVAVPKPFPGGAVARVRGLDLLVDETQRLLPEAQRSAFAAAQSIAIEPKVKAARRVIDGATASAAAMAASPIPFADWLTLTPVMIGMVAGISKAVGLEVRDDRIATLSMSVVGALATTFTARAAASFAANLLKAVPAVGTAVGGLINGAIAGSLTKMLGEAYLDFLVGHIRQHGQWPTIDEIALFLKERWFRLGA
jgi:uncharacterized protein (DUF697 family)/GTP-binding protein EngB required for normal cell division